jgi:subtilisin family serine protease
MTSDTPPIACMDELLDRERIWEMARRGTGRGVRVAVLDTGVEADHPALEGSVVSCHEALLEGSRSIVKPTEGTDAVGHGTACAGIIHQLAPEAELHSVRVIGRNATGTVEQLVAGLEWAIEQGFDVLNLSLGTVQKRMQARLGELVDRAYFQGMILVGAANNQKLSSYPADFAALVGVDNQSFPDPLEFQYRLGQAVEILAHGIYVNAPAPGGKFRLFTGTSFACPHVTGLVARLKSEIPSLTPFQVKTLLWCLRKQCDDPAARGL